MTEYINLFTESCLVSDELLQYRHFTSKQLFDKDLSDDQEEEVLAQFAALDPEKKGHIEWSDFLYFESLAVLKKLRTEVTGCCGVSFFLVALSRKFYVLWSKNRLVRLIGDS